MWTGSETTTYSFNSIVESEANVNGVWDDNSLFIQISLALVAKKRKLRLRTALPVNRWKWGQR